MYWIGLFLLVSGSLSLFFNECTVQVRRLWPWRRDDADVLRDRELNNYYRFSVYAASVICVEAGLTLTGISVVPLGGRVLAYVGIGVWLLYRHPDLRRKRFWNSLHLRGRGSLGGDG